MARIVRLPKGGSGDVGLIETVPPPSALGEHVRPQTGSKVAFESPPIGWARLTAEDDPRLTVLCELDDGHPHPDQGYGGHDEVDRPGNVSLTPWRGFKPTRIPLGLYLDDLASERSVEDAMEILEALAGRGKRRTGRQLGGYTKPPRVVVHTGGLMRYDAHHFPGERWLLDLDWDEDGTIVNDVGNVMRVPVTVTLLQAVADERLQDRVLATARRLDELNREPRSRRRVIVKEGETLVSIARRELGDPGRWVEIARLNKLRDPRAVRPGAKIVLP